MHIYPINNINFRAEVVREVPILKKTLQNDYKDTSANLFEYDINNPDDMQKIKEISKLPGFALYGYEIYQSLLSSDSNIMTKHCFVLLNDAKDATSELNNDNVLGLFTFREMKEEERPDEVELFITNQQFRTRWYRKERDKQFSHIGQGMAKALQTIFTKKSIKCYSEAGAVEFWKKNGFKKIAEQTLILKR